MKTYSLLGIIFIVIGVIALGYEGVSYTTREKVLDIGPIEMTSEKTETIPLSPMVGAAALIGGLALLVIGSKKA